MEPDRRPQLLDRVIKTFLRERHIPGALVSVVQAGQTLLHQAYGLARLEPPCPTPVILKDHSLIGSVTKSMTCYLISLLVSHGKLRFSDHLSQWFPQLPFSHDVTIMMLCNMTSGIPSYSTSEEFGRILETDPYRQFTPEELLAFAYRQPYMFEPGTAWFYSNTNTVLLGLILEELYQQPASAIFQEQLFQQFGLYTSLLSTGRDRKYPLVDGYDLSRGEQAIPGQAAPGQAALELVNTTCFNTSWTFTAGAVVSALNDAARWSTVLGLQPQLTPEVRAQRYDMATVGMVYKDNILFTDSFYYAVGLVYNNGWTYHNGSVPGYNANCSYFHGKRGSWEADGGRDHQDGDIAVAILLNLSDLAVGNLADQLWVAIAEIVTPDNIPQNIP